MSQGKNKESNKSQRPERPLKVHITMTLDPETVEALKVLAYNDDRSLSEYVNRVLKQHVQSKNQQS